MRYVRPMGGTGTGGHGGGREDDSMPVTSKATLGETYFWWGRGPYTTINWPQPCFYA
jgi:hypothetical protein